MGDTKPTTIARRWHNKDWDAIAAENAELLHQYYEAGRLDIENLIGSLAHHQMKVVQLGERLSRWSSLIAEASGIGKDLSPGDDEAEAILVGWATEGWLRRKVEEKR